MKPARFVRSIFLVLTAILLAACEIPLIGQFFETKATETPGINIEATMQALNTQIAAMNVTPETGTSGGTVAGTTP